MAKFDKEHEEKVARELLTHAVYEAQMSGPQLKAEGSTFSSERAKFLIRVLVKSAARGLAYAEGISSMDLSQGFTELFSKELGEVRKDLGVEV